jgi:sugar lactone lactonase YvrE
MGFFSKLLRRAVPLAVLLLAACGGGGVQSGTVASEIRVTTLAGQAGNQGIADGTGTAATFGYPAATTVNVSGNVYVVDAIGCTIRKITPAGVVTTLAGQAGLCGYADGTGTAAQFQHPTGITVDTAGNLYVADSDNNAIRKITPAGVVTTLAGLSSGSADGTGTAAGFYFPVGIVLDAFGNLYVADTDNCTIRKITPAGVVTTLAGKAGVAGSADGTGTAARFSFPFGITIDKSGNLYVADNGNATIRKITPFGVVTTLAGQAGVPGSADGTGTAARFNLPRGIAADASGNLYVTEATSGPSNNTIRKITPAGVVTTLAGKAGNFGSKDGRGAVARFYFPAGLSIAPDGKMYVADLNNATIRKIGPGWPIGGTVSGLANGATMVLQDTLTDTGADNLAVNANGSFIFDMPAAVSGVYSAKVLTPPSGQTCTVSNGSGTATTDVTNIAVDCSGSAATTYKLGGTVSGLAANTSLELQNTSNGENLTVAPNGTFSFKAKVTSYGVTVKTQPTGQTCAVTGGSGTATADVTNVAVTCTANNYKINVSVSGLTGTLALQDNGGDNLSITTNSNYTFATQVPFNGPYAVTVLTQPTGQTCTVKNLGLGSTTGTVQGPVNMTVQCTNNTYTTYTIGGTLSGLSGTVTLQDNGGDDLPLSANGSFTFATPVNNNGAYNVTVLTQPTGQTCSVTSGSGTATANVSNVAVSCVASGGGTVGGTVYGFDNVTFSGTLDLTDGTNTISVSPSASGTVTFTFPGGGSSSVSVVNQPIGGTTGCSVNPGTPITITCM